MMSAPGRTSGDVIAALDELGWQAREEGETTMPEMGRLLLVVKKHSLARRTAEERARQAEADREYRERVLAERAAGIVPTPEEQAVIDRLNLRLSTEPSAEARRAGGMQSAAEVLAK